ncbi:MAG: D-Ala-D-Ala carboxypeptidase family metallohydrolase [Ignavibacteria bacterium]|jgi:uncharacterized protein YcbK (DUF882 family)
MLTKYFKSEELLPRGVTDTSLLDPKLLQLIDEIRELLGVPCTINNYASGGIRQWCGLRTTACKIGAARSQHRLGRAADLHPIGMTADEARAKIKKAVAEGKLKNLGGVENSVSWVHVDCRPRINGKVKWFNA